MARKGTLFLTAMLSCALIAPAYGEEVVDPYALSPEQLFEATVISASRTEANVWEAPAAVFVITGMDIERAGATSIAEALRLAPGVQVARGDTGAWAVSVRGFNSPLANKLLVLIDGREAYDPLFSGVYWEVQDTALEDIDRIEVIRGPGASLWGANAVNGVINIITKSASETQGALVSVASGDTERAVITARYGGALGENTQWRVYGRYFERTGQETLAGSDSNGDWRALRAGFRVDINASARDSFTIQGDIYRSETGQFRSVPQLTAPYATVQREDINAQGGNLQARWTRQLENDARFTAQAYVDVTSRTQIPLKDRRTTFDVDAQYEFPTLGAHDLIAGGRFRHTSDEVTDTAIITSPDDTHSSELFSVFVQDQITLSEHWRLTLGTKVDHNDYTGVEAQPSIRLQWMDGETQMAWAAVSRAVRSPSELEREFNVITGVIPPGAIPAPISVELSPNDAFESEELVAYEIGYRRSWSPTFQTDLALFHNQYTGLAAFVLQPPQILFTPVFYVRLPIVAANETEAQTHGLELVANWRAAENLNLSASYTFLDMELHGPPPSVAIGSEAAEGQSPRQQANVRMQWDVSDRFAVDVLAYYVEDLPAYQVDAYTRLDARLAWRLTDNVQFELVGQGLFEDARREFGDPTAANSTAIERNFFGRLSWRS